MWNLGMALKSDGGKNFSATNMDQVAAVSSSASPADAALPALSSSDAATQSFKPEGVIIHLTPMNTVWSHLVEVRLGNGPDSTIVRPPATIWFGLDGRIQAVATPRTSSEQVDVESVDVDDSDNDDGVNDGEIGVDEASDSNNGGINVNGNGPINGNVPINDNINGDVNNDSDDDEVVFLGEFRNNNSQA